jgi:hypothetical protein
VDAHIKPEGSLELLSHSEISQLYDTGTGGLYELWRQCALAVLRSGIEDHHGPFELAGDPEIMNALENLLMGFIKDQRMHIAGSASYVPCYRILS